METIRVNVLPQNEIRIIKEIIIVSDQENRDTSLGSIFYERYFSSEYKIEEIEEENRDFTYYLNYPKQEYFPIDDLDGIILQSIKNSFPKSSIRNFIYFSTGDVERLENLKNRPIEKTTIMFSPLLISQNYQTLSNSSQQFYRPEINIYRDSKKQDVENIAFFGNFDLNDRTILSRLRDINFI
ncbi:hypothetical protein ACQKCJ_15800 [Flavobacterium sp. NPDC079362]|uniref:hypothetical protein n=1 Tax=Flavobacterium sp. NPDC079362 TaxID=3390566 RepID=UPI003D03081A